MLTHRPEMPINPEDPATWPASAQAYLRRREQATVGNADLVALIQARIREAGPLPFAEYMRLALYHPTHGYYTSATPKLGPEGDFLTSPETHPAFGALVCRRLARMWQAMGSPERFDVVEAGPGTGALAAQVLGYARERLPAFAAAIRYTLVETSADLRARQGARLGAQAGRARWVESLDALAPHSVRGCIFSNELLDALPVHRVQATPEGLREVFVGLRDGEFVEELDPVSTPALPAYFDWVGVAPPVGAQGEVGLDAVAWYRRAARCLAEGYLLTVDYGHPASELYTAARPRGTLLCYYRHTANEEPYRRVGLQDITAHVDFTALVKAGTEEGLRTCEQCLQGEWLAALGIGDWAERRETWPEEGTHVGHSLASLVDPEALGRLRVLVQARRPGGTARNAD